MTAALFTPTFLYLTGGLIIWAVRFLAAYIFTALACARGWDDSAVGEVGLVAAVVSFLTLVAVTGCGAILFHAAVHLRRAPPEPAEENVRFIHVMAGSIAALALLAIIWETLPVFVIPICS
jgi:hypothetical protein